MRGRTAWTSRAARLLAAGVLGAGGLAVVTAAPASAGNGCVGYKGGCGKVVTDTITITTCIDWKGSKGDFVYPKTGHCAKRGTARLGHPSKPKDDVDAIYVPRKKVLVGHGKVHSRLYPGANCGKGGLRLTHKHKGWWKFPNYCTITIEYWTLP